MFDNMVEGRFFIIEVFFVSGKSVEVFSGFGDGFVVEIYDDVVEGFIIVGDVEVDFVGDFGVFGSFSNLGESNY